MGLLDLFSSDSKTENTTTNYQSTKETTLATADNRVTESGDIGGNVALGDTGGNVKIVSTDRGAQRGANQLSKDALAFGSDSLSVTEGVTREAINATRDVSSDSLDFAGDTISESLGFGRDALYETGDIAREGFDFGSDVFDGAIRTIGESQASALDFGSDSVDAIEASNRHTVDTLADQFQFWNQQTSQNVDRSLAFADRANRSEGAAVLESGLKTLTIVAGVAGAAFVARGLFA